MSRDLPPARKWTKNKVEREKSGSKCLETFRRSAEKDSPREVQNE
jgi:hypothetical protein